MLDLAQRELPRLTLGILDPDIQIMFAAIAVDPGADLIGLSPELKSLQKDNKIVAPGREIVGQLASIGTAVNLLRGLGKRPVRLVAPFPVAKILKAGDRAWGRRAPPRPAAATSPRRIGGGCGRRGHGDVV